MCAVKLSSAKTSSLVPAENLMIVYDTILDMTDNHETACDIVGWVETSAIGSTYSDSDIVAELVDC